MTLSPRNIFYPSRLISLSFVPGLIVLIELAEKTPYGVPNSAVIALPAIVYGVPIGPWKVLCR